jgi:integrase
MKSRKWKPKGTTDRTLNNVAVAASLVAQGISTSEIAKRFKRTAATVRDWQRNHKAVWDAVFEKETAKIRKVVESVAGTPELLKVPNYLQMALIVCDRAREKGQPLFQKPDGTVTLRTFYEQHYAPLSMSPDAGSAYKEQFGIALRRWEAITTDPPIDEITNETLALFRDATIASGTWIRGETLSPESVRSRLAYIQRLLDAAGPAGPRNRHAAGIIAKVPYVKPPRQILRTPRTVELDVLGKVYAMAGKMRYPKVDGIDPGDWWRALLAVAYNTGIRRRTIFELRMDDINWDRRLLDLPPERLKAHRGEVIHLNDTAFGHLAQIRGDRDLVFPLPGGFPGGLRSYGRQLHRLQDLAGIPRLNHFGLHNLRKTCGTQLVRHSAAAAQLALGHASFAVTKRHYISAEGFVAEALDKLPQPTAFVA